MQKITPFLWFDTEALEAAKLYTTIFKESKIKTPEVLENTPSGTVQIVTIELFGQEFQLMNAGPHFKFNEAVSFLVDCKDQEEVDYYWDAFLKDGGQESQCGWLKDRFGLSWQIVPRRLNELLSDPNREKANKALKAMLQMKKIIVADLEKAYQS
jgi:predicted 3-demethylubiquinone-9 3-methyltransferase (glyoxalase superfamily)